jgi:hypothetical protein
MSEVAARHPDRPEVALPPPISLSDLWPWALFGMALMLLIYFVGIDEGAASMIPGSSLHEWVHDGRHLLGFPCH